MAAHIPTSPPPAKERGGNGHGPTGHGRPPQPEGRPPEGFPRRRTSVWPLLLDVGVVIVLVSLILLRPVAGETVSNVGIGVGAVLFVVALIGWLREARAEYRDLPD
jgi:drug/metabolite transporter (DMT)-like permease